MRLLPQSAFPLLAFLALLHLGQARQANKPRDKLQLRAKPKAQEVSTDIWLPLYHPFDRLFLRVTLLPIS